MRTAMQRMTILIGATALLLVACTVAGGADDATTTDRRVILHTSYVTGGDAPSVQSMIFFHDGAVRLKSVGGPALWRRLSARDRDRVAQLAADAATRVAIGQLPRTFACCDAAEVAISFEKTTDELDSVRNPPTVPLHTLASMPPPITTLLEERDRIGRAYFGRKYWAVLSSHRTAGGA